MRRYRVMSGDWKDLVNQEHEGKVVVNQQHDWEILVNQEHDWKILVRPHRHMPNCIS